MGTLHVGTPKLRTPMPLLQGGLASFSAMYAIQERASSGRPSVAQTSHWKLKPAFRVPTASDSGPNYLGFRAWGLVFRVWGLGLRVRYLNLTTSEASEVHQTLHPRASYLRTRTSSTEVPCSYFFTSLRPAFRGPL